MGWVSSKALVLPADPAAPSGARGQARIRRGRTEEQSGDEGTVRGAEPQEGKEVENKEQDESEGMGGPALATWPAHGGNFFFFGIMATSDLSSLIPTPFNMRLLPN